MPTTIPPGTRLGADPAAISQAARILEAGGIVAVPTETVYGLAARADCDAAVARIYQAKGRPDFNPLIVHVADLGAARRLAEFSPQADVLAAAFWPGPLTLVLPLRRDAQLAAAVTAGLPTVALRCPAHPVMQVLLSATGLPLAAPSANRSGAVSPTSAAHVAASLGARVDLILDGGACAEGLESTIVAPGAEGSGWRLLRPGPIDERRISAIAGARHDVTRGMTSIEAPGQMQSHYSPGKPLRLGATEVRPGEFLIGFGKFDGDVSLSPTGDLAEAAARLYDCLHRAAAAPEPRIAVAPIPAVGIGIAINDRLARAAV